MQDVVELRKQAAIWSSRFLPFADCLTSDPDIHDLILSVLSELHPDEFLTDMLAFCFPSASSTEGKRGTETKLKRIIARLRSTSHNHSPRPGPDSPEPCDPHPLSVKYQLQSQRVLAYRAEIFGGKNPGGLKESFFAPSTTEEVVIEKEDLKVGDVLFEYDAEYVRFLDTFFSIIMSPVTDEHSMSAFSGLGTPDTSKEFLPFLTEFYNKIGKFESDSSIARGLYPLLYSLIRWAQIPYPQKAQDTRDAQSVKKTARSRKMGQRRSKLSTSMMRVNLSAPVIVGSLREKEDSMMCGEGRADVVGDSPTEVAPASLKGTVSAAASAGEGSQSSENKKKVNYLRSTPGQSVGTTAEEEAWTDRDKPIAGQSLVIPSADKKTQSDHLKLKHAAKRSQDVGTKARVKVTGGQGLNIPFAARTNHLKLKGAEEQSQDKDAKAVSVKLNVGQSLTKKAQTDYLKLSKRSWDKDTSVKPTAIDDEIRTDHFEQASKRRGKEIVPEEKLTAKASDTEHSVPHSTAYSSERVAGGVMLLEVPQGVLMVNDRKLYY